MSQLHCRLCLNETSENYNDVKNYVDQFKLVIPEINLLLTESPMICLNCSNLLLSAYNFKKTCLDTEEKLTSVLHNGSISGKMRIDTFKEEDDGLDIVEHSIKDEPRESDNDNKSNINVQCEDQTDPYTCKLCSRKLKTKRNYIRHVQGHTEPRFKCGACSERFFTYQDYVIHRKCHKDDNKCTICGKTFLFKATLDKHLKEHNSVPDKKVFECSVCGLQTNGKWKLTEHFRIHTGERPYQCTFCTKAFTQSSTLHIHVKSIHSNDFPFVCEVCGKRFPVKGSYTNHMKIHSEHTRKVCKVCGKSFALKAQLDVHIRTHTGEKPMVCHVCSKRFSDMRGLRKHVRIHTGEKPYECIICQKRFVQNCNMKIHYKSCWRRVNSNTQD